MFKSAQVLHSTPEKGKVVPRGVIKTFTTKKSYIQPAKNMNKHEKIQNDYRPCIIFSAIHTYPLKKIITNTFIHTHTHTACLPVPDSEIHYWRLPHWLPPDHRVCAQQTDCDTLR